MRLLRLVLARTALAGALVLALAVPIVAYQYVRDRHLVGDQVDPADAPALPAELHARFTAHARDGGPAFVVLGYHDLVADPAAAARTDARRLTVAVQTFDAHLRMLRLAGFTSVTAQQVSDHLLHGAQLPRHAVMINFLGGRTRTWSHADPVLAKHGFRATVFVDPETVTDERGPVLTWPALRKMAGTGRWSVGMSLPEAGATIATDATGTQASAWLNRGWLDGPGRAENDAEFQQRISAGLGDSLDRMTRNGLPAPLLLSYPFQPDYPVNRVADTFARLSETALTRFAGTVLTVEANRQVTAAWAGMRTLPRLEVYSSTSDELLFFRIREATEADA